MCVYASQTAEHIHTRTYYKQNRNMKQRDEYGVAYFWGYTVILYNRIAFENHNSIFCSCCSETMPNDAAAYTENYSYMNVVYLAKIL